MRDQMILSLQTHIPTSVSPATFSFSIILNASSIRVISRRAFQSERSKSNLAAKKDRAQIHRTPKDKGKGGSWFHFLMLVILSAGQGNQALPKLVHQPPALPSSAGADSHPDPSWLVSQGQLLAPVMSLSVTASPSKVPGFLP